MTNMADEDYALEVNSHITTHVAEVSKSVEKSFGPIQEPRTKHDDVPNTRARRALTGVLQTFATSFTHPVLLLNTAYLPVPTKGFTPYFVSLYNSLITVLYPSEECVPKDIIMEDEFILVCRYYLFARIHYVYSNISGKRCQGRVPIPENWIPKSLADVINGIGAVLILDSAFMVVPSPENMPPDEDQQINSRVTNSMLEKFARIVLSAQIRQFIEVASLSKATTGTAYWLLSPRTIADSNVVADNSDTVVVLGGFREFTPSDIVMASIVQRGFNGLIPEQITCMTCSSKVVTGVICMQHGFNLHA